VERSSFSLFMENRLQPAFALYLRSSTQKAGRRFPLSACLPAKRLCQKHADERRSPHVR
jgi:hypothetical protein